MRSIRTFAGLAGLSAIALAGCGNSTPLPPASQAAAAKAYQPSTGAFVEVSAAQLQSVSATTTNCNLDSVDGKPPGNAPLPHAGTALLAGWAGDASGDAVPAGVQVVLTGAQDYVINAATGALRTDVAAATHKPALATSGYEVNANLSAVAPGSYGVTLLYSAGGRSLKCATKAKLFVQ